MLSDIEQAMATFKTAGIKELILDLRYNGGGDGEATTLLSNYIAPSTAEGKLWPAGNTMTNIQSTIAKRVQ